MALDDPFGNINPAVASGFSGPAQDFVQNQQDLGQVRSQQSGVINQFLQDRQPVFDMLRQETINAGLPGLEQQRQQSEQQQGFAAARSGLTGGSADLTQQAGIQSIFNTGVGALEQRGTDVARSAQLQDQGRAQQGQLALQGRTPGEQAQIASILQNLTAQGASAQQIGQLQNQSIGAGQAHAGAIGDILGTGISNLGGTLNAISSTGGFTGNP